MPTNIQKNNKRSEWSNIDERTLFLNLYSKIDKDNEDFNNVYEWFVDAKLHPGKLAEEK